jgi:CheY-like chemotaxis protein
VIAMPTILCIDDDVIFLQHEKNILEANGYMVIIASDGPTGITLACESAIDVVVLAFRMRGMDGGEVADVFWKHQPDLPIVVCTGFFDAVPDWLRWFAAACVEKRDGPDVLLSAIREAIAHQKVCNHALAA